MIPGTDANPKPGPLTTAGSMIVPGCETVEQQLA